MTPPYPLDTRSEALAHVEAVKACNDLIEAELEQTTPNRGRVSTLNAKLGVALKLAEVYAALAVADAVAGRPRLLPSYDGSTVGEDEEVPC